LTWKEDPYHNSTWRFYFHSLDMVSYLTNAYEKDPNEAYLQKAKWYIDSWMKTNPSKDQQASTSAWRDHSTANRVVNIIYFYNFYKKSSIFDATFNNRLMQILQQHGDFLANDQNYTATNNHGIFQDRSLIELSLLFPTMKNSTYWYNKAIDRLHKHITNDVTDSGIHKEHSPSYHLLVLKLFIDIEQFLASHQKTDSLLSSTILKMEDYLAIITPSNGKLPVMGDSGEESIYVLNSLPIQSQSLKNVVTNKSNEDQSNIESIYPDGRIAIFQTNRKSPSPFYFLLTSAFHSKTHKHADDLSFILSSGKTDFFVDSGKYNYEENTAFRKYFRSTLAHNTLTVDGQSYSLTSPVSNRPFFENYAINNEHDYVKARHQLYSGVKIIRTAIYIKKSNSILLNDQFLSNQQHVYTQSFNVGKNVNVVRKNPNVFILNSKIENNQVELKQQSNSFSTKQVNGLVSPISGWQSTSFNSKYPITQLQFIKKAPNSSFQSIINTGSTLKVESFSVKTVNNHDEYTIYFNDGSVQKVFV
jgi:hypothetical protein